MFSGRPLFAVELILILSAGTFLALWLRPEPHGDWAYYWETAGNLDDYRRGGLSLLLLSGLKLLGLSPVAAALLINLAAAVGLSWLFRRADASESRVFALLAAAYLLLLSPYFGIVQLDLIAAVELAFGIALILMPMSAGSIQVRTAVAVVLVAAAVSTKPQYALTIWAMLGLFALLLALLRRSPPRVVAALLAVLLLGSVTGFATDLGMRALSGQTGSMRTTSAVTLYGGLLTSSTSAASRCGYWTQEAGEAARADMHKPLHSAVLDRLSEKPVAHWLSVIRCKLPQIVHPPPFALYWLVEAPSVKNRLNAESGRTTWDAVYRKALRVEYGMYGLLTLLILAAVAYVCVALCQRGRPILGALAALWILSFWMVHAIFEIQGRYFLGMYLLAPLFCALAMRLVQGLLPPDERAMHT